MDITNHNLSQADLIPDPAARKGCLSLCFLISLSNVLGQWTLLCERIRVGFKEFHRGEWLTAQNFDLRCSLYCRLSASTYFTFTITANSVRRHFGSSDWTCGSRRSVFSVYDTVRFSSCATQDPPYHQKPRVFFSCFMASFIAYNMFLSKAPAINVIVGPWYFLNVIIWAVEPDAVVLGKIIW